MRPLKVGVVLVALLGLLGLLLVGLASSAGIRFPGFDMLFTSTVTDLQRVSFLFLVAGLLYAIDKTLALRADVAELRSALRARTEEVPSRPAAALRDGPEPEVFGPVLLPDVGPSPKAPPAQGTSVRLERVSKTYDLGPVNVHALRDVTLTFASGSLVVVLGPSGSGKTTLLNLLGGIDRATSGLVWVNGVEVTGLDERSLVGYRRDHVGFVFQFFNLIPSLTARENVALAAELVPGAADVEQVLRRVGLADRMDHFPAELSGGEQQRVAIARALVKNPPLLLCDEPTGELDYATGVRILEILRDVAHREGRVVIVVTHNAVVGEAADVVVHLRGGAIDRVVENEEPVEPRALRW